MAASPDAGGARCAPLAVARALSRVIVLGGLVVLGWLLGSGIGFASETLVPSGAGLVQLASDPGARAARSDDGPGGQHGAPPTVTSAVTTLRSTLSLPSRPTQPPVRLSAVQPVVQTVVQPLVQPVVNTLNAPNALATLSRPTKYGAPAGYGAAVRPQTPAEELATVLPVQPVVRAVPATAPVRAHGAPTGLTTVGPAQVRSTARAAEPFAGQAALGGDPSAPIPASPPASTTSACMTGSTGSGAGTKSTPDVAVQNSSATAPIASMHPVMCLRDNDLPRSPTAQPSTSPD